MIAKTTSKKGRQQKIILPMETKQEIKVIENVNKFLMQKPKHSKQLKRKYLM
jgi:hypothetical protein